MNLLKIPKSIYIFQNVIEKDECDYFTNKMIERNKKEELILWEDIPTVLVATPDKEDTEFINKVNSFFINFVVDKYQYKEKLNIFDSNLSLWKTGAVGNPHLDNYAPEHQSKYNLFSSTFYLNESFSGGEINFPNLDFFYKPKLGSMIIFPCDTDEKVKWHQRPHLHEVKIVTSGFRVTVPAWLQ